MKFKFSTSPNYRKSRSINDIMRELFIALFVVYLFGLFRSFTLGLEYGVHTILLLIVALTSSVLVEYIYYRIMKEKIKLSYLNFVKTSFPFITPIIIVLMVEVDSSLYSVGIATVLAVTFSKMLFGGFGQNIFNPAAVGRAILIGMVGSEVPDLITSATVTTKMSSYKFMLGGDALNNFLGQFGGLSNLFIGNYQGALGETSFILLIIVGIVLSIREVIDYRVPLFYLGTILVGASIISLFNGYGVSYPLFQVATGGACFGAIFMLTDPVTNPTTISGRIVFAILAAIITLLIRIGANLPEGVLFSILIMNMFVPMIDEFFEGNNLNIIKKTYKAIIISLFIGLLLVFFVSESAKDSVIVNSIVNDNIVTIGGDLNV